jgi:hypothetical protein
MITDYNRPNWVWMKYHKVTITPQRDKSKSTAKSSVIKKQAAR